MAIASNCEGKSFGVLESISAQEMLKLHYHVPVAFLLGIKFSSMKAM